MGIVAMESFQQFLSEWEDLLKATPVNSIYQTPSMAAGMVGLLWYG
ncbi:MAG: hypothetical protein CM1200mP35_09810 [Chloroflexota bacterium]|nr:MAG: hypothetical protein CM1200mP35_09810 [Chloroflexota bacterium]